MISSVPFVYAGPGTEIEFHPHIRSKSGKLIPQDKVSGANHMCPKSTYALQKSEEHQNVQNGTEVKDDVPKQKEPTIADLLHEVIFELQELRKEFKELKSLKEFNV